MIIIETLRKRMASVVEAKFDCVPQNMVYGVVTRRVKDPHVEVFGPKNSNYHWLLEALAS